MTGEITVDRHADRKAAIAASLEELAEEQAYQEAEEAAQAQAALETMERETLHEQEDILQRHPASQYDSLEEWQAALRRVGFYYEGIEEYRAVLRHPDTYFGYEDDGGGWYDCIGYPVFLPDGSILRC